MYLCIGYLYKLNMLIFQRHISCNFSDLSLGCSEKVTNRCRVSSVSACSVIMLHKHVCPYLSMSNFVSTTNYHTMHTCTNLIIRVLSRQLDAFGINAQANLNANYLSSSVNVQFNFNNKLSYNASYLFLDRCDSTLPRFSKRDFYNVVPMSVMHQHLLNVFSSFTNINQPQQNRLDRVVKTEFKIVCGNITHFSVCLSSSGPLQLRKH